MAKLSLDTRKKTNVLDDILSVEKNRIKEDKTQEENTKKAEEIPASKKPQVNSSVESKGQTNKPATFSVNGEEVSQKLSVSIGKEDRAKLLYATYENGLTIKETLIPMFEKAKKDIQIDKLMADFDMSKLTVKKSRSKEKKDRVLCQVLISKENFEFIRKYSFYSQKNLSECFEEFLNKYL